jgi:transaldolase
MMRIAVGTMKSERTMKNPLQSLQDLGQSVWLDYLRRSLISNGELKRLIEEVGLRGLTSNPSIFEKAIAGSSDYRDMLEAPESNISRSWHGSQNDQPNDFQSANPSFSSNVQSA